VPDQLSSRENARPVRISAHYAGADSGGNWAAGGTDTRAQRTLRRTILIPLPIAVAFLGVPTLYLDWSAIGDVELASSLFSLGRPAGISFMIDGKTLVTGSEPPTPEAMLEEVALYAPEKIVQRKRPKLGF
jgi:hypothetical protein